ISEFTCAFIAFLFIRKSEYIQFKTKFNFITFLKTVFSLFKIGFAQTVFQTLASVTGFIINDRLIVFGGDLYLSSFNIVQKMYMLLLMPIIGLSNANQTIIAYFKNDKKKQKEIIKKTILCTIVYGMVILIGNYFFNDILFLLFKSTEEIYQLSQTISIIIFSTFPLVGILYTIITYLQVTNYEMTSIFLGLTRQIFTIIPLVVFLPLINEKLMLIPNNNMSVFFAIPLADIITTIIALIVITKIIKKNNLLNTW
ncbi:MAG: MATE family efflux transporter, partial [Mycoplasmatales bacterium]